MDNHAFASLAHLRILLLPVGSISQSDFSKYAAEIRSFETIRLGDVPADAKDERARFMPNPLSSGHLQLSFPTHPVPLSHSPLTLLRPSLFPLAVIGIARSSHADSVQSLNAQFNTALLDLFPASGIFPITKTCFVFEEGDECARTSGEETSGVVIIPGMMGNKRIYIGTLLADVCSQILGGFGVIISALESPLGNEYLNSSVMPVLPPLSEIPPPLNPDANVNAFPSILPYNSQPEVARPFTLSAAPTLKRNSTAGPAFRPVQAPKKRLSAIGTTSSHARLYKVLGDFFLLAGRTEDAAIWYNEALLLFKNTNDSVWQACTLEGMATVLIIDSWSAGHGLQNSTTSNKEPWLEVTDKLTQAAALYLKTPVSDGEKTHSLMAYLYTCCILRHTNLLFSVWSAKGWGPLAFTTMLQSGPKPYIPPTLAYEEGSSWLNLERLSMISGISRIAISNVLSQLHGPWLLHLGSRERISILEATAGIYACLGYRRKEAYILREVLGCIMDLMVCGREEDGVPQASAIPTSAGLGIHNFNPRPGDGIVPTLGMRMFESSDGNESILRLLKHTCGVLGIDLEAVQLVEERTTTTGAGEDGDGSMGCNQYHKELVKEYREPFGWPELQVGVVREAVAVAEALPDFPAVAQFALSSLRTLQNVLSPGDQHHLYSTSARALMTARRRGDLRAVEYWSGRPILSISLVPIPDIRLPVEKNVSTLQPNAFTHLPGAKDPFLYNPRKITAKGKSLVTQNEILEFSVVLQNPYIFDLELQTLSLSTSGARFEPQEIRAVIPAKSIQEVILSGKAMETGELSVRGCLVQTPGGIKREFILPLFTAEEEDRFYRVKSLFACEAGRSKYSGLACLPWSTEGRIRKKHLNLSGTRTTLNFLAFTVVAEQPLLRVRRASITHGALMLFNGETSSFRITIENVSQMPINFLRLAFEDSTISPSQQALAEGDLSVFDTYETEYNLIHKPVFSWENNDISIIEPGQSVTLSIASLGKVGCTSGSVHISYASIDENPQRADVFYTRQVIYPIMITVYHALDCCGMDVLPLPAYPLGSKNTVKRRRKDLSRYDDRSWCLFVVDIRNNYGMPFDVTIERLREDALSGDSCVTIPPGTMSRIAIPIEKTFLTEEQISKPIPTLSDRQFVVDKAKLSEADTNVQRKLFWYREALFRSVRGKWKETGGTRTGEISLRQQRLSLPMLEVLRLENARVQLRLCRDDTDQETVSLPSQGGRFQPPINEFVYLRGCITNLTKHSIVFTVDICVDPLEYVVHEGILSDISLGRLAAMESREISIPLCFLSNGRYDIKAYAYVSGFPHDVRRSMGHISALIGVTN